VSSFVGYLPADQPELLCLVVVDSPQGTHWGSQVAAPVFNRVMRRVLSLRNTRLRHSATVAAAPARQVPISPVLTGLSEVSAAGVMDRLGLPVRFRGDARAAERVARQVSGSAGSGATLVLAERAVGRSTGISRVPDVTGAPIRQAVYRLTEAGYRVQVSGSGSVVRQHPASGSAANKGAVCRVICSREG
jgi:stage V sporulation protein D (sporulation-specific penicillin-binding protein)